MPIDRGRKCSGGLLWRLRRHGIGARRGPMTQELGRTSAIETHNRRPER